ncbi:MAG: prepilin-type N-terminal cleavage/methylation domain-containing protein, partial [Proteobacteria bacterium]|nr:prepilin-type N-terminal cleavage/methylation domain-containing protein [Pseudomonadota bacterium]
MKNGSVAIKSNSKNGYSLTEVLVSLAVLGVVSLIVFNLIAMTIEVNSKLERLDVLSDVRKEIRFKFDCSQTKLLLASACPSQFTLRDKNGNPLLQLLPKP